MSGRDDLMDDLVIKQSVEKEAELRQDARLNPHADPSLYTPWGNMGPLDYPEKRIKTNRLD